MGVLWYSIGASRPYEMFTGASELLAGVLLFIPGTSLAGALVALAATTQIFTLNMTYDVPVKLFSFHLILMSLFLLAPEAKRLLNVLVLNRTDAAVDAAAARAPSVADAAHWRACSWPGARTAFFSMSARQPRPGTRRGGGGAPKPPLYGIWLVDEMTIDGKTLRRC